MDERTAILREWFDRVDSDRTGNITALQLKPALAVGNLDIAITIVEQMIRMYDFDRNGTMSFEEFVALNKFLLKVQHAFSDLERGQGYLSSRDVYEALVKMGISLDSPSFYTLSESFDQKKNGRFRLDDFISLCIFVQSARGGLPSISINSSIALRIAAYEIYMNVGSRGLPSPEAVLQTPMRPASEKKSPPCRSCKFF